MTTIAQMKIEEENPDLRQAGYRRTRATAVLALASNHVARLQDDEFVEALKALRAENFDMDRLDDEAIEVIFAVMDNELSDAVIDEFTFVPKLGNIRDLGGCVGHCDLCGKGDSRDDGANLDKIRYEYRLTNTSGGQDVWVGSTCILQHGLHVEGARSAEEAEKILRQTMQQHLRQWKIEAWRSANPDHAMIPEHWDKLRRTWVRTYHAREWSALGLDVHKIQRRIYHHVRGRGKQTFRTASKFYARKGFLTEGKTELWREVKRMLLVLDWAMPLLRDARYRFNSIPDRLDWLDEQLQAKKKESRRRRKPRKL